MISAAARGFVVALFFPTKPIPLLLCARRTRENISSSLLIVFILSLFHHGHFMTISIWIPLSSARGGKMAPASSRRISPCGGMVGMRSTTHVTEKLTALGLLLALRSYVCSVRLRTDVWCPSTMFNGLVMPAALTTTPCSCLTTGARATD